MSVPIELRVAEAALTLGLTLSKEQQTQVATYVQQLSRWNRTYNLTAIRDTDQMLVHHVFDSLAIVPAMQQVLYKYTANKINIVDVGSGAGLPGLILAIAQPSWQVECLDAVQKKMAFVQQMIGVLGLANLRATHARIEALAPRQADIVVSRAFASLTDFATLAGRHVAQTGWLLAMKGVEPQEEIDDVQTHTAWRVSHIQTLTVPELNAHRCLVWMRREGCV